MAMAGNGSFAKARKLVVRDKSRGAHKSRAVFYAEVARHSKIEGAYVLNGSRKINHPQFNCPKDQVLISGTYAAPKAKVGFIIKDTPLVLSNHCHFPKCERCEPEAQELPWREGYSF